ncbi:MAG: VOC family protein [Aridibacter famidurans]|nr:VOC family protein [Aridibacter famidurans]
MNLNQVTVYSRNVTSAIRFYESLGLKLIVDSAPRYVRFECPDGESTLSIHETDSETGGSSVVLYFECDDLDATVESLSERGIKFETGPEDKDWLWREASLRDPDGHRIILFHAGENRRDPPWRVEVR